MKRALFGICICIILGFTSVRAQGGLDQGLSELSQKISTGLTENQKRTIAVVEFGDLEGRVTNFGRFIAEELITRLYHTKKFTVIERQLLNKVVAEQKLSFTGVIDQTSAQKLGKLLGVDAIASGTVTDLGKSLRVNARLIDTSTAVIFAVASTEIAKDDSVITLMGAGGTGPTGVSPGASGSAPSYQGKAIASKDIGSLRVVLKSIMRVTVAGNYSALNGIRCSFEFINVETQKPIVVAMNAIASSGVIGRALRSTIVDENGGIWRPRNSDVAGMSIVGVGQQRSGFLYDPAEIVTMLAKRDDLNSDEDQNRRFIFGPTTEMLPGQNVTVTVTFVQETNPRNSGASPTVVQLATEIVVGVAKTGTSKSYSLHNFTFDQVSLSTGGS